MERLREVQLSINSAKSCSLKKNGKIIFKEVHFMFRKVR